MFWWRRWTAQCWRWRWRLWKLWQLSWGRQECICRLFFRWVCWYHLGLCSSPVAVWVNVLCSGTCGWDRRGYSRASFPPSSGKLPEQWSCGKQQVIAARTWCSRQACTAAAVALSLYAPYRWIRIINIRLWIVMGFLTVVGTDRALRVCLGSCVGEGTIQILWPYYALLERSDSGLFPSEEQLFLVVLPS